MSKTMRKKKPKTVETLERNDCRWPLGDPREPDFHFCGQPRVEGRPYCELHCRAAFMPPRSRELQSRALPPVRRAA
jgi:GcrA cell cycle regulator